MRSMPGSVARIVSRPAEHPIVADDGGIARLRRFDASLLDAALEGPKRLERGYGTGSVVGHGEMNEGAVAELQGQVANALRRLLLELSKHLRDQALVLLRLVRSRLVAQTCRRPRRSTSPMPTTACFAEDAPGWPKDSGE